MDGGQRGRLERRRGDWRREGGVDGRRGRRGRRGKKGVFHGPCYIIIPFYR